MSEGLNGFVKALFDGYKAGKEKGYYRRQFRDLNKTYDCWIGTASTRLLEVDELEDLLEHAEDKEDYESILDHMYRFDATRVGYYKRIEKKIINEMWEED